jgi:hypothetical protein
LRARSKADSFTEAIADRQAAPTPKPLTAIAMSAANGGPSLAAK